MGGIYLVFFIGKYEKTFRDLGSGFIGLLVNFLLERRLDLLVFAFLSFPFFSHFLFS